MLDYVTGPAPQDLYDTGHTLKVSRKACVQLQGDSVNSAGDMMQTSDEVMMVQKTDVLMVVDKFCKDCSVLLVLFLLQYF